MKHVSQFYVLLWRVLCSVTFYLPPDKYLHFSSKHSKKTIALTVRNLRTPPGRVSFYTFQYIQHLKRFWNIFPFSSMKDYCPTKIKQDCRICCLFLLPKSISCGIARLQDDGTPDEWIKVYISNNSMILKILAIKIF